MESGHISLYTGDRPQELQVEDRLPYVGPSITTRLSPGQHLSCGAAFMLEMAVMISD